MHLTLPGQRRGFTLVEILIVTIILGIMASIVVPQLVIAGKDAKESVLKENLRQVRSQLIIYLQLHTYQAGLDGSGNAVSGAEFRNQMTQFTSLDGGSSTSPDATHRIRPCLSVFPVNPITDKSDVLLVTDSITCDNSTGWVYNPLTGEFYANSTEYGPGGKTW